MENSGAIDPDGAPTSGAAHEQRENDEARPAILLVEDDASSSSLMAEVLGRNYAVTFAVDGRAALAAALAQPFDLVLMDINLPEMDGIEAARRINAELGIKAPPIIMLTAYRDPSHIDAAFAAGAQDYVSKPVNVAALRSRVRSAVERKRMHDRLLNANDELQTAVAERTRSLLDAKSQLERKIGELHAAQGQLQASVEHLDGIMSSVMEGIITIDEDARIASVNRFAERMFGYTATELIGQNVSMLMPEPYRSAHDGYVQDYVATGRGTVIGVGAREVEALRKDGFVFPIDLALSEMRVGGRRLFVGMVSDISERKRNVERIAYLANFDPTTGLPNRNLFRDRLARALVQAERADRLGAVLYVDLDGFRRINETLGHHVGDRLLRSVGERIRSAVRSDDTVARVGGDEFTIVLEDVLQVDAVNEVADAIVSAMGAPFLLEGYEVVVSVSIGIAVFPFDSGNLNELLANADAAMYRAKESGRNRYSFFSADRDKRRTDLLKTEIELRRGVETGQLVLYYQPQIDPRTGGVVGLEGLARWVHPERGVVLPGEFVPLLESMGLIVPAGRRMLADAVKQAMHWRRRGFADLRVSINLSPRQFDDPNLVGVIETVLKDAGADGDILELEITEGVAFRNAGESAAKLRVLRDLGLTIAIDDFGTGYSSLGYLRQFPVDVIKVDRTFVKELDEDADAVALVRAMVDMSHSLGLKVVAEGAETEAQLRRLAELGCDIVQGYVVSEPVNVDAATAFLEKRWRAIPAIRLAS